MSYLDVWLNTLINMIIARKRQHTVSFNKIKQIFKTISLEYLQFV